MTELVHLEVVDRVATITLDSEHNRNALSRQLVTELAAHLQTADRDPDVLAIVLRSAHRVFCSGADLSEAADGGMKDGTKALIDLQRLILAAETPVVVVLAGPVRAGGLGIVGAADIVLAAESVNFALTEVRLGLAPAVISVSLLSRLSERAASDLFLTARKFSATEAAEAGLVTRVVADDALVEELEGVLNELRQAHPQGLRETKRLLNASVIQNLDARGPQMAELSGRLFSSDEAREAMLAFLSRPKG